jgi:hypothetical protein
MSAKKCLHSIVDTKTGKSIALVLVVVKPICEVCKKSLKPDSLAVAISEPICSLVHDYCWQFVNFNGAVWPHDREFDYYQLNK